MVMVCLVRVGCRDAISLSLWPVDSPFVLLKTTEWADEEGRGRADNKQISCSLLQIQSPPGPRGQYQEMPLYTILNSDQE